MTDSSSNILLLARDGEPRRSMSLLLDGHGYHVDSQKPANDAISSIKQRPPQLMICCMDPLGPLALESLRALQAADPASGFILITGTPESEIAETARHEGALLLTGGFPASGQFLAAVETAFKLRTLLLETQTLNESVRQLNLDRETQATLLKKANETQRRTALESEKARRKASDYAGELAAEVVKLEELEAQLAHSEEVRQLQAAALRKEDERRRQAKDPDLIISAIVHSPRSRTWSTCPSGSNPGDCVKVTTADGKEHYLETESYSGRRGLNLLSKCVMVHSDV